MKSMNNVKRNRRRARRNSGTLLLMSVATGLSVAGNYFAQPLLDVIGHDLHMGAATAALSCPRPPTPTLPGSLRRPRGPRGSLAAPAPSPSPGESSALPPGKEVVAWEPTEPAGGVGVGTKATLIRRHWQPGPGAGAGAGPQVPSHFREAFLWQRRSEWYMEGASSRGLLGRLGWLLLWPPGCLRPWAQAVLLCSLLEGRY